MARAMLGFALALAGTGSVLAQQVMGFAARPDCGLSYAPGAPWTCAPAVGDYDGDGWLDVFLVGGPDGPRLFHNNHDRTFSDVSGSALPEGTPNAMMAVFADIDNDGDADLYLARWCGNDFHETGVEYLRNDGGAFALGGLPEMLASEPEFGGGMALGDTDRDGDLDVVRAHQFGAGYFLRGDADLSFPDETASFGAGFDLDRRYWSIVLADFNNDGWPDLHAAIDFDADYHARNRGDGTFEDVSESVGVGNTGSDMGVAVGDIESDGDLDIFSTNMGWHALYVNDGTGVFTQEAQARGVDFFGLIGSGWGTQFADLDNDGDLDLAAVDSAVKGKVFINRGDGYFTRDDTQNGLLLSGYGLVSFDYDRDGDLDLLVSAAGAQLYENNSPALAGNHWVIIDLTGVSSNRDGIGARLYAQTGGRTQMRELLGGESFVAGPALKVHFGLGTSEVIDRLEIRWPSGATQALYNLPADREYTILEQPCQGEIVPNGVVDLLDLSTLLIAFGQCDGDTGFNPLADLDADGCVKLEDLQSMLDRFGSWCE